MSKWYKVGAKFTEQKEDGTFGRVTKYYLIQGESFTDAEMSAYEKLKKVMRQGGEVISMKRVNVHKIIEGESDQFFELKISFLQSDDSGKKEKRIIHNIFMRSDSAEDAVTRLRKLIKSEYPYYNLESFSTSDVQTAFPMEGIGVHTVGTFNDNDEDEEEFEETNEGKEMEVSDDEAFVFPDDLDKVKGTIVLTDGDAEADLNDEKRPDNPTDGEEKFEDLKTKEELTSKAKPEKKATAKPKAKTTAKASKKDDAFEMPE